MDRPRWADVFWIALVTIGLGGATAVYIAAGDARYLHDYRANPNPDARHYVLLGRNFWQRGAYSRMARPPYTPDVMRTPVYPLVAGGLDLAFGGVWAVYAFQLLCHAGLAACVYALGCGVFGRRAALLAGLLLASDLMLVVLDFEAMSESLFNLLAGVGVLLWLREITLSSAQGVRHVRAAATGALLALAILTRPAGLYLPVVLGGTWVILACVRRSRRLLAHGAVFLLAAYLPLAPWVVRNYAVFGVPHLTTADPINLVYFAGGGSYGVHHGVTLEEAQEMIHREYGLVPLVDCNNFWNADRDVARIDAELRATAPRVLLKYPGSLAASSLLGVGKSLIAHNAGHLAAFAGKEWVAPGLGSALRGDLKTFSTQLARNDAFVVAVFIWELFLASLLTVLGCAGAVLGLASPRLRLATGSLILIGAYYLLTVAVVGLDAYARHRAMLVPLLCLLSALVLARWPRQESAQPPVAHEA